MRGDDSFFLVKKSLGGGEATPSPQGIPQASLRLFENLQRGLRLVASFLVFTDSPPRGIAGSRAGPRPWYAKNNPY